MIEVNLKQLKDTITKYNDVLKTIEDNNTDIIHNFNELNKHWQDERMIKLNANMNLEQQRILNLERNVKSQLSLYKEIAKGYEKIGKSIKCNLSGKDVLNVKLENIINKLENLIARYNSLGDISFYPRAYVIRNQKRKLTVILKEFKEIKSKLNGKFNEIKEIENIVQKRLATIKIQAIAINNYEREE